jgi:transketolase
MVAPHGFGYLGQALSSAELLAALYLTQYQPEVDDLVCSPGHYIIGVYAAAIAIGVLDERLLDTYGQDGSELEAIGTERSSAVDLTCGSLGMGISAGVGFALANRLSAEHHKCAFVIASDGEMEEGQTWEAALFAAHHGLDRLTVLLDANDSQVDGPVSSITTIEPLTEKWRAFGWDAAEVDGHDVGALSDALESATASPKPSVVIARTSTRQGLSVLPEDADGHFIKLPPALAAAAIAELEARIA